jgi:hypothetical protein
MAGVLLTACGGGSTTLSTPAAAGSTAIGAAAAGTSAAAGAPASSSVALGNSDSSFCQEALAEQAQEAKDIDAFTADTPAQLEQFEQQALNELAIFVKKAPAAIKSAVQTIADADQTLFNDLKAVNFDYTKLGPNIATSFDTPSFMAATTTVTNYLASACGITDSDSAPSS